MRITACGICGSDLHLLHAGLMVPGIVPGHEFTGVVDALGTGVTGTSLGDLVAVEPFRTCGTCPECRSGNVCICRSARLLGVHDPGGLAGYAVAPAERLFPVPAGLAPEIAALAEPLAVVVHALERGALEEGQRVLVLGAGSIGLLTVLAARALGAGEVLISARYPHQAELAEALGADRILTEEEGEPAALDALGRRERIDLVVETVGGQAETLNAAAAAARPGGTISVVGVFLGRVGLDGLPLLLKELTLTWSYCYHHESGDRADFRRALDLLDRERNAVSALVTRTLPLEEVSAAFALAADKKAGTVKVSLIP